MGNQDQDKKPLVNDPFDPSNLRLSQTFDGNIGARKELVNIPVRKPGAQEFIRISPKEELRMIAALLNWQEDGQLYLVTPAMVEVIGKEAKPHRLVPAITATEIFFVWPMKITPPGERENTWNMSADSAAQEALEKWVNIGSNKAAQMYEVRVAEGEIPEPKWPELSLKDILRLAFKDRFIQSIDHPIVKKLRGVR